MANLNINDMKKLLSPGKQASLPIIGSVLRELVELVDRLGQAHVQLVRQVSTLNNMLKSANTTVGKIEEDGTVTEEAAETPAAPSQSADNAIQTMSTEQLTNAANSSLSTADAIMDAAIRAHEAEKAGKAPPAPMPQSTPQQNSANANSANGKKKAPPKNGTAAPTEKPAATS